MDNGGVPLILFYDIQFYEVGPTTGFIDLPGQDVAAFLVAAADEHGRALFRKDRQAMALVMFPLGSRCQIFARHDPLIRVE
jgi:hypothetical protein